MGEVPTERVRLVPFNPACEAHAERMYKQRLACGWGEDMVQEWRRLHTEGAKGIYWLALSDGLSDKEKLLDIHLSYFPEEKTPLKDDSTGAPKAERVPTMEEFVPIGHIALEQRPDLDKQLELPGEGVAWATALYISRALHDQGLGRSAMRQLEKLAMATPLSATTMALDTVCKEFHLDEDYVRMLYEGRGIPYVAGVKSNEEWYERQGYKVIAKRKEGYQWRPLSGTETWNIPVVFLAKSLV